MSKKLDELVNRYAAANAEKIAVTAEVKDLGDEIKDTFGDAGLDTYTTAAGWVATITMRNGRKLNLAAVEKLLGYAIPDSCYEPTQTAVLNVKAAKAAKGAGMAVVKAVKPTAAVVAA